MAGQYPDEVSNLTRSKITNAYEHVDDSDTAGARKRVQMYVRDRVSGEPVQLAANSDGDLNVTATVNPDGLATSAKQDDILAELELKASLTDIQPVIIKDEIPTNNNSKIELGYNAVDELIWIYKTITGTVYKRAVTDDNYTGGTDEVDITRTKTFDTWTTP